MTEHHHVMHVLSELRTAVPGAVPLFTQGGCHRLYLILRAIWPEAEAWYDSDHVITRIGGRFYDITGEVTPDRHQPMDLEPRIVRDAFTWAPMKDQDAGLACPCKGAEQQ